MERTYRPTWAEIDLGAVSHNLAEIRRVVASNVAIMPVVKANAYGHGIYRISAELITNGVKYLGVATVDEALFLRQKGIDVSILVLGSVLQEEADQAVDNNITLTLCNDSLFRALMISAKKFMKKPRVHIKIDTGMGRIGVWHADAFEFIKKVYDTGVIEIEGVYTHFSSASRDKMYTEMQIEYFENVLLALEKEKIGIKYKHADNSIASVEWKNTHYNLVRPGILIYGVYPKEDFREVLDLKPVMSLKTRIVHLKDTPTGRALSYGRTYITQKPTKIATLPIGYADGYGRLLSNRAEALVHGEQVRVVGIVTMDQTLIDVGEIVDVKIGDEVVLFGEQKGVKISVEKISKLAKTIPYEILSGIKERVPRIYI
ncbi:MAG: alanine racemase [Candidatus Omnitrophica bacterium]|nr:alanine racemase [Candidatus Omnitrophota bacterium]